MKQRNIIINYLLVLLCSTACLNLLSAQCDNPNLYPAATQTVVCGNNTISPDIFAGEYSITTGYQDQSTVFLFSSVATDYITLRKTSDNSVIAAGVSSVTIVYQASYGNIEVHINMNAACGTEAVPRTSSCIMTCGCDNPNQYPAGSVGVACGENTISSNIYAGEYSVTSGYQDQSTLVFFSSIASDYITIRKASDNMIIAHGPSPQALIYLASDGLLEVHINTNVACGAAAVTRVSSVAMTCGCNNAFMFPATNVSLVQGVNTISTVQYAGDYNVTQDYIDGSICTYASSVSTDYITLRRANDNYIIAAGLTPLTIEYSAGYGNVEMHINTDAACGVENINRTTTVSMHNIFNGGHDDGYVNTCFAQPDNPILAIFKGGYDDGFVSTCMSQPDNPILAIFKGGYDDGFVSTCLSQADNPILAIFKGGHDDGFMSTCLSQPDAPVYAIYKGGNEDGYSTICFSQPDNPLLAIFKGGNDDGFVSACMLQPDNPILAIFKGGADDGFTTTCFSQPNGPDFAIYTGGHDDGFVSNCFSQPNGPDIAIYTGGHDDGFVSECYTQADGPIYAIYQGGNADGFFSSCFAQADGPIWAIYRGGRNDGFTYDCYEQCAGNTLQWIGTMSIDWHTPGNWECGFTPIYSSDVIIPPGVQYMPTVSGNDVIHSLWMQTGTSIEILPPAVLTIK